MQLGAVKKLGFDDKGYERRERLEAIVDCVVCGNPVECWADTHEWTQMKDGRWRHAFYGGAMGECCGKLYADCLSDGFQVFDLSVAEESC